MSILHKDNNGIIKEYTAGGSKYNLNYSTDETDTGMTWIDGKKIYRKVYYDISVNTSSGIVILADIDLTSLNISNIVELKTYFYNSTITMPISVNSGAYNLYHYIENNHYYFAGKNSLGDGKIQIILEYTKSTN